MRGLVSADPRAGGCGVAARFPDASTRRPSFSIPRRMARNNAGGAARWTRLPGARLMMNGYRVGLNRRAFSCIGGSFLIAGTDHGDVQCGRRAHAAAKAPG